MVYRRQENTGKDIQPCPSLGKCKSKLYRDTVTQLLKYLFIFKFLILFICAYIVWVISPPVPLPSPLAPPAPSLTPLTPHYQAETILPLSLILLKREYKQ
jgi:hypothetical protein